MESPLYEDHLNHLTEDENFDSVKTAAAAGVDITLKHMAGFAEWIDKNCRHAGVYIYNGESKTTKQLIDLYLKHLNR